MVMTEEDTGSKEKRHLGRLRRPQGLTSMSWERNMVPGNLSYTLRSEAHSPQPSQITICVTHTHTPYNLKKVKEQVKRVTHASCVTDFVSCIYQHIGVARPLTKSLNTPSTNQNYIETWFELTTILRQNISCVFFKGNTFIIDSTLPIDVCKR